MPVEFRALYKKTKYMVETADGWSLVVTRYRPVPQTFAQPLFGEPMLLVHGFSQNRHAWTSGEFVKNLLFFGLDIHILELRGHGKSSVELQHERSARVRPPACQRLSTGTGTSTATFSTTCRRRSRACGASPGASASSIAATRWAACSGYGYAGIHDDFEGIVTIGAAGDLGKGALPLKLLALAGPSLSAGVDAVLGAAECAARHRSRRRQAGLERDAQAECPRRPQPLQLPLPAARYLAQAGLRRARLRRSRARCSAASRTG